MRGLLVLACLLCLGGIVAAQPMPDQPAPAGDQFNAPLLMRQVDIAVTLLAQEMLVSDHVKELQGEGLIVAPFYTLVPDADDWIGFIISWIQEKMTTAQIQEDIAGRFDVIDRARIDTAMQEMGLDAAALRDPKMWPALGKATGARYMLTGSIAIIPMAEAPLTLAVSVTSRIVALDTGRALCAGDTDFVFRNRQELPPAP